MRTRWLSAGTVLTVGLLVVFTALPALGQPAMPAAPAAAAACPLADKLPGQSLLYIGWGGIDANRAALKQTGLSRTIHDPEVEPHLKAALEQAEAFLSKKAGMPKGMFDSVQSLVFDVALPRPGALSLVKLELPQGGQNADRHQAPVVEVVLLIDLGAQAGQTPAKVDRLLTQLLPAATRDKIQQKNADGSAYKAVQKDADSPSLCWGEHKGHLVLTLGAESAIADMFKRLDGGDAMPSLAGNPQFARAMARVPGSLLAIYADTARFRKDLLPIVLGSAIRNDSKREQINKALDVSGLLAIDAASLGLAPSGRDFVTRVYLQTPQGKPGLLVLADQKPIATDLLMTVPSDATFLLAVSEDRTKVLNEFQKVLAKFPQLQARYDDAVKAVQEKTGLTPRELAAAMGDGIAVYNAPSAGGFIFSGLTIVAEVRDAAKVEAGLNKLAAAIAQRVQERSSRTKVEFREGKIGQHAYHYTVVSSRKPFPVSPAWCVTGKYVVISMFPQTLRAALAQIDRGREGSLLANQGFVMRLAADGNGASAIWYLNTHQMIEIAYPVALPLWQVACSMAAKAGMKLDVDALPRQSTLLANFSDSFAAVVPDPEGITFISRGPLPLIDAVANPLNVPLEVSILLPALGKARGAAERTKSGANLRNMGKSIAAYQASNNKYPDSLQQLVDSGECSADILVAPQAKSGQTSYIYIKPVKESDWATRSVLIYEDPAINGNDGANVLFQDGHVEWVTRDRLNVLLDETRKEMSKD
ncbi:MAG: hypothetical protein BIFFINMI_04233 [Phycisphaerae bacterium]|nr:hypothetical protein [Phycisphaerae bacterium]